MSEMTVNEAKELLSAFGNFCGKDTVPGKNLQQIAALLESQAQTIEKLKCCGNCKFDDSYCPATAEIINDKCNAWEGENKC